MEKIDLVFGLIIASLVVLFGVAILYEYVNSGTASGYNSSENPAVREIEEVDSLSSNPGGPPGSGTCGSPRCTGGSSCSGGCGGGCGG